MKLTLNHWATRKINDTLENLKVAMRSEDPVLKKYAAPLNSWAWNFVLWKPKGESGEKVDRAPQGVGMGMGMGLGLRGLAKGHRANRA